jgi:catechol 2,3-dioxygenase-like lactoylglutathione lyase family enzyme
VCYLSCMVTLGPVIPVFRMFDLEKAREFYVGFLGFRIDWEHRFEPEAPVYMQVSREGCVLHLSEHFGDGSAGASIRVGVSALDAYCADLNAKGYRHARPGVQSPEWGREMVIRDPFGNKLVFFEPKPA